MAAGCGVGICPVRAHFVEQGRWSKFYYFSTNRSRIGKLLGDGNWLSDLDSNQDNSLQRAVCYRYTIGQAFLNV